MDHSAGLLNAALLDRPVAVVRGRPSRRLFDKVMIAFHQACDLGDLEAADHLLTLLEVMTTRRLRPEDGNRRRGIESLVAAHERLWHLRRPHWATQPG